MTHVVLYIQSGCPACHEHLPRLRVATAKHRIRLQVVNLSYRHGVIEAQKHHVRATPTTDVFTSRGTMIRRVGAMPDDQIDRLLTTAVK